MKINKNYFSYLFNSKKLAWIFICGIYVALAINPFYISNSNNTVETIQSVVQYASLFSLLLSFVLPIFMFSFVQKKRSVDQMFALPIRRSELLITTITFMFLVCLIPFVITTFISILLTGISHNINILFCLLTTLHLCFSIIVMLCVNTTVFLFANNTFDGMIILAAYICLPLCYIFTLNAFTHAIALSSYSSLTSFSPALTAIKEVGNYLSPILLTFTNQLSLTYNISGVNANYIDSLSFNIPYLIACVVYLLISMYFLKKHFIDRKVERAEEISNNIESYPFIINFYLIFSLATISFSSIKNSFRLFIILYIILFAIYLIAICIYKRKIKFYIKNIIFYICIALITFGASRFIFMNEAFGLGYMYPKPYKDIIYNYNSYNVTSDLKEGTYEYSNDNVEVFFQVMFNKNNMKIEKYQKAYEVIDKYRRTCIKEWFSSTSSTDEAFSTLNVDGTNDYFYSSSQILSIEDLKTINAINDSIVYVQKFNYDTQQYDIYDLSEYLNGGKPNGTAHE